VVARPTGLGGALLLGRIRDHRARLGLGGIALAALTPGRVVEAIVDYEDGNGAKRRPVIVVAATRRLVLVVPCTTRMRYHGRAGVVALCPFWSDPTYQQGAHNADAKAAQVALISGDLCSHS
jgi:hypothetical protein